MSVREDLIAARDSINTLNKWGLRGSLLAALRYVIGDDDERIERANQALGMARPARNIAGRRYAAETKRLRTVTPENEHADIMALFDRAIAAARSPQGDEK